MFCNKPFYFWGAEFLNFFLIGKIKYTERNRERERDQDLPSDDSVPKRAQWPKPRSRNFFQVSHADAVSQGFGPSSTAFPSHKKGAGWEVELLKLELAPIWDLGTFKVRTLATKPCHQVQEQNYFQRNIPKLILQQSGGPTTELAWLQAALPITHSTGTWTSIGVMGLLISVARFFWERPKWQLESHPSFLR